MHELLTIKESIADLIIQLQTFQSSIRQQSVNQSNQTSKTEENRKGKREPLKIYENSLYEECLF